MPFVIQQPTLITNTNTIVIAPTSQMLECACIEVINDTQYACNLILPGNVQSYMAPQTSKIFYSNMYYGDDIKIIPIQVTASVFTNMPQEMTVLGFRHNEHYPPDGTTFDLNKMVWVGNTIQVGAMSELQNDNNPAGTAILETTVSGQASSNQTATNDGLWSLGVLIGGSIVKWLQSSNIDPIVKLGAATHMIEALGNLTIDGNLTVKGTSSLDNGAITTNGTGTITATLNGNASTATSATSATTATNVASGGTINAASETLTGAGTALTVNNNATISGTATIGTASVTNNETVGGTLTVTGDATFNGAGTGVSVAHNLSVTGTSSLDNGNATTDGTGMLTLLSTLFTGSASHPKISGDASGFMNFDIPTGTRKFQIGDSAHGVTANDMITANSTTDAFLAPNGALSIGGRTVNFNGNTSGSGVMYQVMTGGGFKLTYIHIASFNNTGAANTDVVIPVAYVEGCDFFCSSIGNVQALASGVAQSFQIVTTLAAGGGTPTSQTTLHDYSWAHVGGTSIDTIRFTQAGSAHSGAIIMFGR